jgi:hypothetical protein
MRDCNDRLTILDYNSQHTAAVRASRGASGDGRGERAAAVIHRPAGVEGEQTWW